MKFRTLICLSWPHLSFSPLLTPPQVCPCIPWPCLYPLHMCSVVLTLWGEDTFPWPMAAHSGGRNHGHTGNLSPHIRHPHLMTFMPLQLTAMLKSQP